MSIICCIVRDLIWKVAKFQAVRDKALSDAFLCIVTLHLPTLFPLALVPSINGFMPEE